MIAVNWPGRSVDLAVNWVRNFERNPNLREASDTSLSYRYRYVCLHARAYIRMYVYLCVNGSATATGEMTPQKPPRQHCSIPYHYVE